LILICYIDFITIHLRSIMLFNEAISVIFMLLIGLLNLHDNGSFILFCRFIIGFK
jgi:hypothetical protein